MTHISFLHGSFCMTLIYYLYICLSLLYVIFSIKTFLRTFLNLSRKLEVRVHTYSIYRRQTNPLSILKLCSIV